MWVFHPRSSSHLATNSQKKKNNKRHICMNELIKKVEKKKNSQKEIEWKCGVLYIDIYKYKIFQLI